MKFRLDTNCSCAFTRKDVDFVRRAASGECDTGACTPAVRFQNFGEKLLEGKPLGPSAKIARFIE